MRFGILSWRSIAKGALRGFASVRLPSGLILNMVTILTANGRTRADGPGKSQIGSDDRVKRDDRGKVQYVPVVEFVDTSVAHEFSRHVIEGLLQSYPGARADGRHQLALGAPSHDGQRAAR
jgi:hypothetical protein